MPRSVPSSRKSASRPSAEQPRLLRAGRAEPQRQHQFHGARAGVRPRRRHARHHHHFHGRNALHVDQLHARWRHQSRHRFQPLHYSSLDRLHSGIQVAKRRLPRRVRPRSGTGQRLDANPAPTICMARSSTSCATSISMPGAATSFCPLPPRIPTSRINFGYVAGGPVWIPKLFNGKNKLFWTSNWEGFKEQQVNFDTCDLSERGDARRDFSEVRRRLL